MVWDPKREWNGPHWTENDWLRDRRYYTGCFGQPRYTSGPVQVLQTLLNRVMIPGISFWSVSKGFRGDTPTGVDDGCNLDGPLGCFRWRHVLIQSNWDVTSDRPQETTDRWCSLLHPGVWGTFWSPVTKPRTNLYQFSLYTLPKPFNTWILVVSSSPLSIRIYNCGRGILGWDRRPTRTEGGSRLNRYTQSRNLVYQKSIRRLRK